MADGKRGIHAGHRARMRKKFQKSGFDGLEDHEILEMLLYYAVPRVDTNELAHTMLDKYKTLANVFDSSVEELTKEKWISEVGATLLTMIPKLSMAYENSRWAKRVRLPDVESWGNYLVPLFKGKLNEEFALLCMDKNRFVRWSGIILKGTIDRTEAYPRRVVEEALNYRAVNVVLAHNHPSGTLAPSVADKEATDELVKILKSIGIDVLDHIIVGDNSYFSMREMGFIR